MPPPPPPFSRRPEVICVLFLLTATVTVLSQSVVEYLPGFPGKLPFVLETGYTGIGESEEIEVFYYFIESERSPESDPFLLWLTGGPGCTGFSSLVYEIGPINFDYANSGGIPSLISNPYSWTKVANVLFLDQPAGTGFSYAKTPEAYECSDTLSATLIYKFLVQWLKNHPKYLKNPLYITGSSYSGITVPLVLNEVYKGIDAGSKPVLNIKGYVLANPVTDMFADINGRVDYAHRMGLLSDELYESVKRNCNGNYQSVDSENTLCMNDLRRVDSCTSKLDQSHILEPWCDMVVIKKGGLSLSSFDKSGARFLRSVLDAPSWCRSIDMLPLYKWANLKAVRKALHVREGTITEWTRCNLTIKNNLYTYDVSSTVDYHKMLTRQNCRALIYSGDHDLTIPHTATQEWIRSLKVPVQSAWRPWFVQGQIAGYTTKYFQDDYELTFATVKGAGHLPSEYKPMECLPMIEKWLRSSPL